jgi:hypothetical protein
VVAEAMIPPPHRRRRRRPPPPPPPPPPPHHQPYSIGGSGRGIPILFELERGVVVVYMAKKKKKCQTRVP